MKLEPQKYLAVQNGLWSRLESTQVDLDLQVESNLFFKSTFEVATRLIESRQQYPEASSEFQSDVGWLIWIFRPNQVSDLPTDNQGSLVNDLGSAQCLAFHGPDAAYNGSGVCDAFNENTFTIHNITDLSGLFLASFYHPASSLIIILPAHPLYRLHSEFSRTCMNGWLPKLLGETNLACQKLLYFTYGWVS
jgi:hypothetical protein